MKKEREVQHARGTSAVAKRKPRRARTPAKKYRFMLGTTSRVPGRPGWHYLILDIDSPKNNLHILSKHLNNIHMKTENGWHIYTSVKMKLKPMLTRAVQLGADRTWARLALKRGWAFLADKGEVKIPWPVERAIIGWRNPKDALFLKPNRDSIRPSK